MEIRLATIHDVDSLFELNEQFNGQGVTTKELMADSLMNNDQEKVFLVFVDGVPAGFCCVQLFKSVCYATNYAEITELFVREAYRRRGVGTALLAFAEDYFKDKNVKGFQLLTGKNNKAAQAFYEKNGYQRSEEWLYRKKR
ncbi:GNAT family N-acetyltransferase [Caldibacillus debilis]|uniref:GNAT family N-acetyltransferase n=1 Tax=Caldibacillus debilis TaxID=301148 RepID=UPI000E3AFBB4|nr:GNAT family N-acetyltransferase [Caldibacillus debilis]REJ31273.1 MAG: N-acetyltransferase [Caldibacillus debilis]